MKAWTAVLSLGVIAGFTVSAVADDDHHNNNRKRVFRAQLVGLSEVPSVSTPARGQFYAIVNQAGTELTYWLSFSDISAAVTQAHIHFGQHHTNGGISVWLCEGTLQAPTASTPACGMLPTTAAPVTGVITAAEVIGPGGQGIAAMEFAELLAALRAGAAYANVHSAMFPGGEIRGQIH